MFNEMKGVYSSPDSVFYRAVQRALFPDNTYRHDSGGDPEKIPELTFEKFQDFHARYYHPRLVCVVCSCFVFVLCLLRVGGCLCGVRVVDSPSPLFPTNTHTYKNTHKNTQQQQK